MEKPRTMLEKLREQDDKIQAALGEYVATVASEAEAEKIRRHSALMDEVAAIAVTPRTQRAYESVFSGTESLRR